MRKAGEIHSPSELMAREVGLPLAHGIGVGFSWGLGTLPLPAMAGAAAAHAPGGGNTINLTVNAGLGTDGRQVGSQIIAYLRDYERTNGNGWQRQPGQR